MPCRNDYGPCEDNGMSKKLIAQRKKTDKLAAMLCALCQAIEKHHPDSAIQQFAGNDVPGLRVWWASHKRKDATEAARKAKAAADKKLKANALKKLSPEEKKALGL